MGTVADGGPRACVAHGIYIYTIRQNSRRQLFTSLLLPIFLVLPILVVR